MIPSILLAHPGTQYSFHLANQLSKRNYLNSFHTCLAINNESPVVRCALPLLQQLKIRKQLENRWLYGVSSDKLFCYPMLEIKTWWQIRNGIPANQALQIRNAQFQIQLSERALTDARIIIGYDTSSEILAKRAKLKNKFFILDQSIAHPVTCTKIASTIQERFPEWKDSWRVKSEEEINGEKIEHQLADIVVVPSKFVANSLVSNGVPKAKIRINPFGTDTIRFQPESKLSVNAPFVFLYVGSITARKGLPTLINAWRQLNPKKAELWIVGPGNPPNSSNLYQTESIRWFGKVSREELPTIFQQAHVFVFPSFFEGLAQVQLEAAACGLPIIATTNSGGEDIIEEGKTGFVIEPGNQDQLASTMQSFLEDPSQAIKMRQAAISKASLWSWSAYGNRWQKILDEFA